MRCPHCARDVSAAGGRCPACDKALPASVATGVLTPPPGDSETFFFDPSSAPSEPTIDSTIPGDTTGLPTAAGGLRQAAAPTGPLTVGQPFSSRYIIVRLLGIGGMGAVYQAWDGELNVMVALKVIRPEATKDPVAAREVERRFKQELLLARQVTHKNVVRIHDLGEIDGIKYITMPYVEGEDLATVLKKADKLPVATVMALARQIASGLVAAHEAGVVHRDLKPANIMIENDRAIIMDFGIARMASPSRPAPVGLATTGARLDPSVEDEMTRAASTMAGTVVGTVEYMAPEQARGLDVDERVDVYAFGLIVYDMLAGRRRAAQAGGAIADLQKRLEQAPVPVRSIVPEVPEPLDRLVSQCVEPDAAKRYQSSVDLVAALDRLDDRGKLRPIRRVVGLPLATAVAALLLALSGLTWWYTRPPVQHDPVSVVIADLDNRTRDPAFDGTLEPMLRRALEGAGFISAFDRNAIRRTLGVQPPDELDAVAARELAVKQGLGVVLAASLESQPRGYRLAVSATHAVTGDVVASVQESAAGKDQVLEAATRLMTRVRNALGDEASESEQIFAMQSLSATSLDVVRHFADALKASSNNRFEEQRDHLLKAVAIDPTFGIGYQSLATASNNLRRPQDALKYINEAVKLVDGMTERERYNTRGMYFRLTGDFEQCASAYGQLISRYAADVVGHNQLANCLIRLRRPAEAVAEMRSVVAILPNLPLFRTNLSWFASYAGDFVAAEEQARGIENPDRFATLALAFAQLGQGQVDQARATYQKLASLDALGASIAASGLGDLAAYEGRFSEAVRLLEEGAAADLKADSADGAAAKLVSLAHVHLLQGNARAAVAAADRALMHSSAVHIRFLAGRAFVEAGDTVKARGQIESLADEILLEPQAHAKIIEGQLALKNGDARQAVRVLQDANRQLDTWIGHFELGRAYLAVGGTDTQADSEFDNALRRRGEALSLFLNEEPTYSYLPLAYYYQGRARQNIGTAGFRDSFRQYLQIRGNSTEDPLLKDIRTRVGQ
jgi:tetratricopeptide (TPR) repeat protein/tRNA A-37 threonylcarbamoyl transferase component Bud32